jgi:hypothetical protein
MTLATGHSRLRRLVSGGLLLATLALAAPAVPVAAAGPRDVMPDLAMAVPDSFRVCGAPTSGTFQTENCPDAAPGNRWLRFDSLIVNVGRGTFRVVARRASVEQEEMGAVQWIRRTDKTWRKVPTNARLAWAIEEDGHPHWHTQGMEKYRLFRLPERFAGGAKVGVKRGYCFFDGFRVRPDLPNARSTPLYSFYSCGVPGQSKDALKLRVGMSVGWGDEYPWNYAGQRINISNAQDGEYLLCLTADPQNEFQEIRETNNESWARIRLTTTDVDGYRVDVEILERGTTACHDELPYDVMHLPKP